MLIVHMYIWKIIKVILEVVVEKSWTWNWLELCPEHAVFISVLWSCPRAASIPHLPGCKGAWEELPVCTELGRAGDFSSC